MGSAGGEAAMSVQVIPADHLNDLMSTSDYIVAALPHTQATDKLISRSAIQAMKKTGVFVNVGRGGTVDEPALIEGRLVGLQIQSNLTEQALM